METGDNAYVDKAAGKRSNDCAARSTFTGVVVHKSEAPGLMRDVLSDALTTTEATDAAPKDAPTAQANPKAK